jgi:hypothetical protein
MKSINLDLIKTVMNYKGSVDKVYIANSTLVITRGIKEIKENIHSLTHKCKEWVVKNHRKDKTINDGNHFYVNHISSSIIGASEDYQCCIGYRGLDKDGVWMDLEKCFNTNNEVEAVLKATEWIIEKNKETR